MSLTLITLMLVCLVAGLLSGVPVAFVLGGVGVIFALLGWAFDVFPPSFLFAIPQRFYGLMTNQLLIAVPLFIFMGVTLEKSKVAENLLNALSQLFGHRRGGLGLAVVFVGALMAASTGIVGATVVTLGVLALNPMLKAGIKPHLAGGTIAASGTLGQIIPPSIVLILLADQMSGMHLEAQNALGNWAPNPISVGDFFAGSLIPGVILVLCYAAYQVFTIRGIPQNEIPERTKVMPLLTALIPPLLLMVAVLGSILGGIATSTEASAIGAVGAMVLAGRKLSPRLMSEITMKSVSITAMIFTVILGASMFSLTFIGLGGHDHIERMLLGISDNPMVLFWVVMLTMFLLGFFLDFIEIIFIVVPVVVPILLKQDISPVWLGVMMAVNLQTSFLTPPFGFALFYLRGVAPKSLTTGALYRGVLPYILMQGLLLGLLAVFPELITWLPSVIFSPLV